MSMSLALLATQLKATPVYNSSEAKSRHLSTASLFSAAINAISSV